MCFKPSLFVILFVSNLAYADLFIIVNKEIKDEISVSDIKRMYMAQTTRFQNDKEVKTLINPDSAKFNLFSTKILGLKPRIPLMFWSKLFFTGKPGAPTEVENDGDVIKFVLSDSRYIGVVGDEVDLSDVRIVYTYKD